MDNDKITYHCAGCGTEFRTRSKYYKGIYICPECRKKDFKVVMKCSVCGADVPVVWNTIKVTKDDKIWRCKKCNDEFRDNSTRMKLFYANMTPEQRAINSENRKKGWKKRWEDGTGDRQIEAMKKGRAEWYNSLTEEEKHEEWKHREAGRQKWWNSLTKEEIESNRIMLREELAKFKKSLSEEELKKFYDYVFKRLREGNEKYWDEMTHDQYRDMKLEHAKKLREERESHPDAPLPKSLMFTEVEFKNMLNINKLNYIVQCPSVKLDERFEEKFPVNPVTGTNLVDPTHLWDFLVRTYSGDVFIDIDGSVHKTNPNVINNDLKRPYQTDGNMAFAIQCLDDNIDGNHIAINVTTGEKMLVKDLLSMLQAMNNLKRLDISIKDFKL